MSRLNKAAINFWRQPYILSTTVFNDDPLRMYSFSGFFCQFLYVPFTQFQIIHIYLNNCISNQLPLNTTTKSS